MKNSLDKCANEVKVTLHNEGLQVFSQYDVLHCLQCINISYCEAGTHKSLILM
jgi:hypothetical protein